MNKQQVLERFCELSKKVMIKKFKSEIPADCFCGWNIDSGVLDTYRFDEKIMEFIEKSVEEKLP